MRNTTVTRYALRKLPSNLDGVVDIRRDGKVIGMHSHNRNELQLVPRLLVMHRGTESRGGRLVSRGAQPNAVSSYERSHERRSISSLQP